MVALAQRKRYAGKVVRWLRKDYPDARCSLDYASPLQLLIATMLSAQCTDERVNRVTKDLFRKYPTTHDFATARIASLEKAVHSTGFYRNKAKNIKACCRQLIDRHDGEVPANLDDLVALPGVGRKTAHVVLGNAFQISSGVVVDTHVGRIARRLGMTNQTDAVKVETDLNQQIPRPQWILFGHRMIQHGRQICMARNPRCDDCSMRRFCPRSGIAEPLVQTPRASRPSTRSSTPRR